jgi:hypothetical protein
MHDGRLTTRLRSEHLGVGKEAVRQVLEKRFAERGDLFEAFAAVLKG